MRGKRKQKYITAGSHFETRKDTRWTLKSRQRRESVKLLFV